MDDILDVDEFIYKRNFNKTIEELTTTFKDVDCIMIMGNDVV